MDGAGVRRISSSFSFFVPFRQRDGWTCDANGRKRGAGDRLGKRVVDVGGPGRAGCGFTV